MQANLQVFDKLKSDITVKLAPSLTISVSDDNTKNSALLAIKEVKHFSDLVESKRKELVDPLNQQVKQINAYAKSIMEPVENSKEHLKKQLLSFELLLEKARKEEAEKLAKAKAKAEADLKEKLAAEAQEKEFAAMFDGEQTANEKIKQEIETQAATERAVAEIETYHKQEMKAVESNKVAGVRKIWKFEVTNLDEVPREFMMIDEKKINESFKQSIKIGQQLSINGILFYQDSILAVR